MASWQMHDANFPAHIMLKARNGEISLKDLLLIHVIDKLTIHGDDGGGRGCKASNAYLADAIGSKTKNYVSDRIGYLRERGWLLSVELDGQRYIEMEWSRTNEEREELDGKYGKLIRADYKRIEKQRKTAIEEEGGTEKTVSPHTEKTGGGIPKKQYQKDKDNIKSKKQEGVSASAATLPPVPAPPFKLSFTGDPSLVGNGCRKDSPAKFKTAVKPEYLEAAKKLRNVVRQAGERFGCSDTKNADQFRLMIEHEKLTDVLRILRLFCKHYPNRRELRLPQIGNGEQFKKRFDWIRDRLIELDLLPAPTTDEEAVTNAIDEYMNTPGPKNLRTFYALSAREGRNR
jgi:hypothetical protein